MTIITTLSDRELGKWVEAWTAKHIPPGGNIAKVLQECSRRLRASNAHQENSRERASSVAVGEGP